MQCKRLEDELTAKIVDAEVADSDNFRPPLAEYFIATTLPRDAKIQEHARILSAARLKAGKARVGVLFWEDLCNDLSGSPELLSKHFPGWAGLQAAVGEPVFSVKWVDGALVADYLLLRAASPEDCSLVAAQKPYFNLEGFGEKERRQAEAYNAALAAQRDEPGNDQRWIEARAPERFASVGKACGICVSASAAASDVLVHVELPPGFEVLGQWTKPRSPATPLRLPERPALTSMEKLAQLSLGQRLSSEWGLGGVGLEIAPLLRAQARPDDLSVKNRLVTAHLRSIAPRRSYKFTGSCDGITIVAPMSPGSYRVPWKADSRERRSTQTGELQIEVGDHDDAFKVELGEL